MTCGTWIDRVLWVVGLACSVTSLVFILAAAWDALEDWARRRLRLPPRPPHRRRFL